jgi:hypothetical protein
MGYFSNDKKNGLGIYSAGDENKKIVGIFKDNELDGLALQYNGNSVEKYMIMDKNKIRKVLGKEEVDRVKRTDEFMNLMIFVDEANIRCNTKLL